MRQYMVNLGDSVVEDGLAHEDGWIAIVEDLAAEGLDDEEIAALLRQREAWEAEAREMKLAGFPYDEIACHLLTLKATWMDVAMAFLAVGLPAADMLRAILPFLEGEECWPVVRVALLDGTDDSDLEEVRGVLGYFFGAEEEVLAAVNLNDAQRESITQRWEVNAKSRAMGLTEVQE